MKIGITLPGSTNHDTFRKNIREICEAGFEHIEFGLDGIPLIIEGEVSWEWVNYLGVT